MKKAKSSYIPIEKVRRERSGSAQWHGISRKAPSFQAMHQAETGYSGFYKKFK